MKDTKMDKEVKRTETVYHNERTKNARYIQRDDAVGPEQFDQILQAIEPHICQKCTKMGGDGLIQDLQKQFILGS